MAFCLQVSQAGRAQLIKHASGATTAAVVAVSTTAAPGNGATLQPNTKTITRTVSEAEMNAILRRQQQQGKNPQVAQVYF